MKAIIRFTLSFLATFAIATFPCADPANAAGVSKVRVMTQNQYLGADLTGIIAAETPGEFNEAVITALGDVAANNYPERVQSLAATIAERSPQLVGLQATVAALQNIGAHYEQVATVTNLRLDFIFPGPTSLFQVPGIPVFLDLDLLPDIFVTVVDRDVILAHSSVAAVPVSFVCARPSDDGCNFVNVASTSVAGVPINIERGFVAVDATIRGDAFRFVNTHLEVRFPDPEEPLSMALQAAQSTELLLALTMNPEPADSRVVLVGDFNSDPGDVPPAPFLTPYQQIVSGLAIDGTPVSMPFSDTWLLRPQDEPGLTCCEDGDLLNATSVHVRRVDIIFSKTEPDSVNASRVLNTKPGDKTSSGLWPSDHATVDAMLQFRGR
jgi:endonuclease/exonuclease/phosphatase family metal-dependent hydrolase